MFVGVLFFLFACQNTKKGSSPLGDRDPTPYLALTNLIQAFNKKNSSSNTQNGWLKKTLSVVDGENVFHKIKKIRLQF